MRLIYISIKYYTPSIVFITISTLRSTIIIILGDNIYREDLSNKVAIVYRYIMCSFFINFDILCTISRVELANVPAIVSSTGTMSLTHPPFLPHLLPVIGYYKDSVSGEVSKWQFPRVQLFAVPADVPSRDGLFRRIEILLKQIVSRIIRTDTVVPSSLNLYKFVTLAFSSQSLKMYEFVSHLAKLILTEVAVSQLFRQCLLMFWFSLIARCNLMV